MPYLNTGHFLTMEKRTRLYHLLELLKSDVATPQDLQELRVLLTSHGDDADNWVVKELAEDTATMEMDEQLLKRILQKIDQQPARIHFIRRFRWVAAAVFVFLLAGVGYFMSQQRNSVSLTQAERLKNNIQPGASGALLTLSDGRKILLDTAHNGLLAEGFTKQSNSITVSAADVAFATVSTPNGRTQYITLSDGTQVWLNAGSSVTFPTAFKGSTREVSMTGEVYFEVAKDESKHFFAQTKTDRIEVKGTHFNINAYNTVKTTLLEGAVKIGETLLTPGHQYVSGSVDEVDVREVMAWKNGMFRFSGANIRDIMAEVARWYNVDVVYEGDISKLDFNAAVPRQANIAELLKTLELTKTVEFNIENNRIIVKPL